MPKDVAIYAFFSGKIDKFGNHTDVKDLTNFKSVMVMMIITTARAGIGCAQNFKTNCCREEESLAGKNLPSGV